MSKILKVNFSELSQRGKKQKELAERFEKARQDYQKIINSLNECWEGQDATEFIKNCDNYLNYLKEDTIYFNNLGEYFSNSSFSYGMVVARNKERVTRMNSLIEENVNGSNTTRGGM